MPTRAEPHVSSSTAVGVRVRALFDEARRRARRRRWAALVAAAAVAAAAVALVVASHRGHPADVAPSAATPARLALPNPPGIGVACPAPNSIACDRVGIAVWLGTTPRRLVATIGGHSVLLRDNTNGTGYTGPHFYTGYLQPAGLLSGALRVMPDKGRFRWYGRSPAPVATLRITATYADGRKAVATRRVPLGAGFG